MARQILPIAGAIIGNYIAPGSGAAIGGAIGAALGAAIDPIKLPPTSGPRLDNLKINDSQPGGVMPKVWGTVRVPGFVMWGQDIQEVVNTENVGGKGGPTQKQTTYKYYVNLAFHLCDGTIDGIRKIWADGKLVYDNSEFAQDTVFSDGELSTDTNTKFSIKQTDSPGFSSRLYRGISGIVQKDSLFVEVDGDENTPGYKDQAYIVFENLFLEGFGNRIPNFTFEVSKSVDGNSTQPEIIFNNLQDLPDGILSLSNVVWNDKENCYYYLVNTYPGMDITQGFRAVKEDQFGNIEYSKTIASEYTFNNSGYLPGSNSNINLSLCKQTNSIVFTTFSQDTNITGFRNSVLHKIDCKTMRVSKFSANSDNIGPFSPDEQSFYWAGQKTKNLSALDYININTMREGGVEQPNELRLITFTDATFDVKVDDPFTEGDQSVGKGTVNLAFLSDEFSFSRTYHHFVTDIKTKSCYVPYHELDMGNSYKLFLRKIVNGAGFSGGAVTVFNETATSTRINTMYFDDVSRKVFIFYTLSGHATKDGLNIFSYDVDTGDTHTVSPLDYSAFALNYEVISQEPLDFFRNRVTSTQVVADKILVTDSADNFSKTEENFDFVNRNFFFLNNSGPTGFRLLYIYNIENHEIDESAYSNNPADENYLPPEMRKVLIYQIPKTGVGSDNNSFFLPTFNGYQERYNFQNGTDYESPETNQLIMYGFNKNNVIASRYPVKNIISEIMLSNGYSVDDFDLSEVDEEKLSRGFLAKDSSSGRGYLELLLQAYNIIAVDSEWKIKFKDKEEMASVATIQQEDLGVEDKEQFNQFDNIFNLNRIQELDLPQKTNLSYYDIYQDHQQNTQTAERITTLSNKQVDLSFPIVFSPTEAKQLVDRIIYETWTSRDNFVFSTNRKYNYLEPSDLVTIVYEGKNYLVRITKRTDSDGIITFEAQSEFPDNYNSAVTEGTYNPGSFDTIKPIASTKGFVLNIPILTNNDNDLGSYTAAASSKGPDYKWSGASLYLSQDNEVFDTLTSYGTENSVSYGLTDGIIPDWAGKDLYFDNVSYVDIVMKNGTLTSVSLEDMLNDNNLMLIGSELLYFQNADLIATNTYRLTGFIRGAFGTEYYIDKHLDNEEAVLIQYSKLKRDLNSSSLINKNVYYKFITFSASLFSSNSTTLYYIPVGQRPYPVSNVTGNITGTNLHISWDKRVRGDYPLDSTFLIDQDGDYYQLDFIVDNDVLLTVYINGFQSADFDISGQQFTTSGIANLTEYNIVIYKINGAYNIRSNPTQATIE